MHIHKKQVGCFQEEEICLTCLVALETGSCALVRVCVGELPGWQPVVQRLGSRVRDISWHSCPEMKLPKWAEHYFQGDTPSERIFPATPGLTLLENLGRRLAWHLVKMTAAHRVSKQCGSQLFKMLKPHYFKHERKDVFFCPHQRI